MDVLSLLKSRNRCLEKFLDASEYFLRKEDFNELPVFEARREGAVQAFALYDRKLTEAIRALGERRHDPAFLESVRQLDLVREQLLARIQRADQAVVARIEAERERLQIDLLQSQKSSEKLRKFKSYWVAESGEGLDRKL